MRVLEEVHNLLDLFLGLVTAGHVGEGHCVGGLVQHAGLALAKAEGPTLATALHLTHEVDPHANEQQHGPPADQQGHEHRAFFAGLDVELDVVGDQVTHQAAIQVGRGGADAPVVGGDGRNLGATLAFGDGGSLDPLAADFFQEV